jgi:hypothetical protein
MSDRELMLGATLCVGVAVAGYFVYEYWHSTPPTPPSKTHCYGTYQLGPYNHWKPNFDGTLIEKVAGNCAGITKADYANFVSFKDWSQYKRVCGMFGFSYGKNGSPQDGFCRDSAGYTYFLGWYNPSQGYDTRYV